jgi:hypothetical protein
MPLGAAGEDQERRTPRVKRVSFSQILPNIHDVTPYAEKYGVHPSFFDFDKRGEMTRRTSGAFGKTRWRPAQEGGASAAAFG